MPAKKTEADHVKEFGKLFLAARREHRKAGKEASADAPAHQAALKYARQHNLGGAEVLLRANVLYWQGKYEEACSLIEEKDAEIVEALHGWKCNARAAALIELKECDKAIEACQKALDDPNFYMHSVVFTNLGLAYSRKGENDKAIEAYLKALQDSDYDTPGIPLNNLGVNYADKGETDKAIEAYLKALQDPDYHAKGLAWTNLGVLYYEIGRHQEAIKALETALQYSNPNDPEHLRANRVLALLRAQMNLEALNADDRSLLKETDPKQSKSDESGPEQRILRKLDEARMTQYEKYLEKESSDRDNVLSILRGWSSAVTLLEGSERLWRGGGYFLKWQDKGIVIDPGFDFLRNFHDAEYHGREIDVVLVSHNHPDHNSDLKDLDDLRYEVYSRRDNDGIKPVDPYFLLWDRNTREATKFDPEVAAHRHPYKSFFSGHATHCFDLRSQGIPLSVMFFEVRHNLDGAMGLKIVLHDGDKDVLTIGYSGDTEFFDELGEHLSGCDILLAHISEPRREEFTDPNYKKKVHLGYRGTVKLIKAAQPKLTLIGEFWAGFDDMRIDLVQGLRRLSGTEAILPTGIGMHIDLPSMKIECTKCGSKTRHDKVRVAPAPERFGNLSYLCPDCLLY